MALWRRFAPLPHDNVAHDPVHVRTATYVVASPDAPAHVRAQADYVCDGVDDDVEIQAAIDALPVVGGKVQLSQGWFRTTSPISIIKQYVWLQGQGPATTIYTTTDINSIDANPGAAIGGIRISDLRIVAAEKKATGMGIRCTNLTLSHIDNVSMHNQAYGIVLNDCTIIRVSKADIRETRTVVIQIDGGTDQFLHMVVADNAVDCSTAGLRILKTESAYIDNCDFIHCGCGVRIDPPAGKTVFSCFFNIVLADNGDQEGILLSEANGGRILRINFVNCWAGDNTHGVNIAGGDGIRFIGLKCVLNAGHGFIFAGGKDNILQDSDIVSNNTPDLPGFHGIEVAAGVSGFNIINNRAGNIWEDVGYQRYGIHVEPGASDNYIITGNDLRNNVTGGLSDGGTGVNKDVSDNLGHAIHAALTTGVHSFDKSCRVFHSVAQAISSDGWVNLAFDSERWDTDDIHHLTTNNSRLTCKTAGKYLVMGCFDFAANDTGIRKIAILRNGNTYVAVFGAPNLGAALTTSLITSMVLNLAVNDYVELRAYQNSGANLNVVSTAEYSPEFAMARIA